jgi:hypothetical protein
MGVHRTGLQIWAIISFLWLMAVGILASSAYSEAKVIDQVKLQQQAKDIRAAGGDPATVQWGGPVQIGGFIVPPTQLESPLFWQHHGVSYAALGVSLPWGSMIVLEIISRLLEQTQALQITHRSQTRQSTRKPQRRIASRPAYPPLMGLPA